jgi:hypothetical protein
MQTVKEYLESTFSENEYENRSRIECNDGFSISVQGGTKYHYCSPRKHCNVYNEVELGYPSKPDILITKYAEDNTNLTDTVYGYVPIAIVEELIQKHGGIKA